MRLNVAERGLPGVGGPAVPCCADKNELDRILKPHLLLTVLNFMLGFMKKIQFLIPAFALAALAFAGCSDDDTNNEQPAPAPKPVVPATELKFTDDAQAALTFVAVEPEAQIIALTTDAEEIKVEQVLAEEETAAAWCKVTVKSVEQVEVAPLTNTTTAVRSIKYRISAEGVEPIEFTVTQDAGEEEAKNTLSVDITPEGGMYTVKVAAAGGQVDVATVTTDAPEGWTAEVESALEGVCTLDTASGATGEKVAVTFTQNTTGSMRMATLTIAAGTAEEITIYLTQEVGEASEVKLYEQDNHENALTSPYAVAFDKDLTDENKRKEFLVEANGEYEVKVVETGTSDVVAEDTAWLEASGGYGSLVLIAKSSNTGAERKVDVILVNKSATELFRLNVTQAGDSTPDAGGDAGGETGGETGGEEPSVE